MPSGACGPGPAWHSGGVETSPVTAPRTVLYRERLTPSAGLAVVPLIAGVGTALALVPVDVTLAVVAGVVLAVAAAVALIVTSPVVAVVRGGDPDDGGAEGAPRLLAGGAVIPVDALGVPEVLDAEGLARVMGPAADVRAWVCHRPWVRGGVRVPVVDPRDATPYWVICTRRPTQLIAALGRR